MKARAARQIATERAQASRALPETPSNAAPHVDQINICLNEEEMVRVLEYWNAPNRQSLRDAFLYGGSARFQGTSPHTGETWIIKVVKA